MSKKNIASGNFDQEIKEIKNKKGVIIEKKMSLIPKKSKKKDVINTISLDEVNKIYKEMIKKVDRSNILIRAMCIDGIKTLKSYDHEGDDLRYAMEDYYNSLPVEVQGKFNEFLYVELIVRY